MITKFPFLLGLTADKRTLCEMKQILLKNSELTKTKQYKMKLNEFE